VIWLVWLLHVLLPCDGEVVGLLALMLLIEVCCLVWVLLIGELVIFD